jgi:uncharacterized protein with HEPN domain
MTEEAQKYISDITGAIELIEDFIQGIGDFDTYNADLKTQRATERELAIIGEALNKLRKVEPEFEIEHERKIISFRNRLVHAYDNIDNAIVWNILQVHLPKLKKEIVNK